MQLRPNVPAFGNDFREPQYTTGRTTNEHQYQPVRNALRLWLTGKVADGRYRFHPIVITLRYMLFFIGVPEKCATLASGFRE